MAVKQRSPSYPGITLEAAIARAKAFFSAEGKHEALVSTAVGHWKYGPKSSGGLLTIAALKSYGLMEDRGNGADRKVRLTPLGLSIVQDERMVSPERDSNIKKAALTPQILADLWNRYGLDRPSNDTVAHYLKVEREFTPTAAIEIIKIYEAAIRFAKLDTDELEEEVDSAAAEYEEEDESCSVATPSPTFQKAPGASTHVVKPISHIDGEEIANIRVSRTTTIRLLASGPYTRQSIEALVAQLKLGLELRTYDELSDDQDS